MQVLRLKARQRNAFLASSTLFPLSLHVLCNAVHGGLVLHRQRLCVQHHVMQVGVGADACELTGAALAAQT